MAVIRPDQLGSISGIQDDDIIIIERYPDDPIRRKVLKIKAYDFLSAVVPESTTFSNVGSGFDLVSGLTNYDLKVKSLIGGENIKVSEENNTLFFDFTGEIGGTFAFFSNIENNTGPIAKDYHPTPTTGTFLSGVTVDTAGDLKVYLRWDGPVYDYVGYGSIEGVKIPDDQIVELAGFTRRFEGYLDNVSYTGQEYISGEANGKSALISLKELGPGPTPTSLVISDISSAIQKSGTELGTTHLKGDDQINVTAVFDTDDVYAIHVYDSGISDGIAESSYPLSGNGDGTYTAIIPVTITNNRTNGQSVSIIARNNLGSSGDAFTSSNQINLDQTYPLISASDPSSYNGRVDGLRSGESTTFVNSISNWNASNGDIVSYSTIINNISITNDTLLESPKTVSYLSGNYSDSDNLRIRAVRINNGAVDTDDVKIKISNPPQISAISFDSGATSAQSPNLIGTSEVKGGDVINSYIDVQLNESDANDIRLQILNSGLSEGQGYSNYSHSGLSNGVHRYTVPIIVTNQSSRDGVVGIQAQLQNSFNGIIGDEFSSSNSVTLNNTAPSVSISSVSYPGNQQGLKDSESGIVSNTASDFDIISYTSPNNQLIISNPTTQENSKSASRQAGDYNVSIDNFTITATKTSNGLVASASTVVKIVNTDLEFYITNLTSPLSSSESGVSYNFNLASNQLLLETPNLFTSLSQTSPSELITGSQGTNTNSNSYTIKVRDADTKGNFAWRISGQNLAGRVQNIIAVNPNYELGGFSTRTLFADPRDLAAGLISIGTSVSNPNNVFVENTSKGGSGPNGGTVFSYQSYSDGVQLDNTYDLNNKFTVCDSSGITLSTGDHIFNLDKLNRAANSSVGNPAQFVVEE